MTIHDLPHLLRLREAAEQIGVSAKTLRRAVLRGELRCIRPTPSATAPILLDPREIARWLDECGRRQLAPRPGGNG